MSTELKRKIKIGMLERDLTIAGLATSVKLSQSTIENAIAGRATAKTKQAITNALCTDDIWPGVKATEVLLPFRPGFVCWPSEKEAANFLNAVGAAGTLLRKNLVQLRTPTKLRVTFNDSKPPQSEAEINAAIEAAKQPGFQNVITLFDETMEAEAIAEAERRIASAAPVEQQHSSDAGASEPRTNTKRPAQANPRRCLPEAK